MFYEEDNPGWIHVQEALRRGRDVCNERGIPFVVALYPAMQRRGPDLTTKEIYAKVEAFCRAEGIACLDLQPAFEGVPVERMWVHYFDAHPNPQAHRLAARAVAQYLLDNDLLVRR